MISPALVGLRLNEERLTRIPSTLLALSRRKSGLMLFELGNQPVHFVRTTDPEEVQCCDLWWNESVRFLRSTGATSTTEMTSPSPVSNEASKTRGSNFTGSVRICALNLMAGELPKRIIE